LHLLSFDKTHEYVRVKTSIITVHKLVLQHCAKFPVQKLTTLLHFPLIILAVKDKKEKEKVKALPLQASTGPEGSRKLRFPDYVTTAQNGGKVVSLTHRPLLPPGKTPGTNFC
jgi:hypothetical protein